MDRQTAQLLAQAGLAAPSADNSQPSRFAWDGHSLQISYDAPRVAGRTFAPDSPATLLSVGAILENLNQVDQHYKLEMTVDLPTVEGPTGSPYATVRVARSAAAVTLNQELPLFSRHTNRFPYDRRRAVPGEVKNALGKLDEDKTRLQCFEARERIVAIAQLARQAAEIRFQTREVHELLANSLRYSTDQVDTGDGMDVRTLHLPPGGALFMRLTSDWNRMRMLNKLGAYKFMANVDSKLLSHSPMIIAVSGTNNQQGAMNAGKLLCRTWTLLNAKGLAVHPYYVVADQMARLREGAIPHELIPQAEQCLGQAGTLFELADDETLYMLLRVGYPTKETPRSRRLPLNRVFTDLSDKPNADR